MEVICLKFNNNKYKCKRRKIRKKLCRPVKFKVLKVKPKIIINAPKGEQGPVGSVGPAGAVGLVGPAGPVGPPGPIGPAGPMGPRGANGAQGIPGLNGAQGLPGIQGVPGAPGATGAPGAPGATGAPGVTGAGISDFLSVYRADPGTGTDTVAGNAAIQFNGLLANVGGAFTFVPPSTTITINETGSYLINFVVHNQGNADFNLTVNGTPITPVPFTGNGGGPTAAEVIISVTTVPTTIQIVNANATPAQLHNDLNVTMTILKLTP